MICNEDSALYKCVTSTSPNSPLLTRLPDSSTSPQDTFYLSPATEVLTGSPVSNVGMSRVALLSSQAGSTDYFQDQAFPT